MTTTIPQILSEAKQHALDCHLGEAVSSLRRVYDLKASLYGRQTFEEIEQAHRLMIDYMVRGYEDQQRNALYGKLSRQIYRLVADLEISWRCKNNHVYVAAFARAARMNTSTTFIREVLECFVGDVAMLSLIPEAEVEARKTELYTRHHDFMERLFCSLVVSCQWTEEEMQGLLELLLLPTIDSNDALQMVSAITLSATQQFDMQKTRLLAQVYAQSQETPLRQRALVGFVLSLRSSELYGEEQRRCIDTLKQLPDFSSDLVEMQEQVFYCLNAERDYEKIESDIMPEIVKNSNLRVTRFGIEEKEPDALENMLNPDAEEKAMEQVEKSMMRMHKMMQAGSDIYFGGFKMMKRFPFFSELGNWFAPFMMEHPALADSRKKLEQTGFLKILIAQGSFCESDKYSLALAMAQVVDRLPANMREMMGNAEMLGPMEDEETASTGMRVRRLYLQDLYRFFRVHPLRGELRDPFVKDKTEQVFPVFFLTSHLFSGMGFEEEQMAVARFLHRKHLKAALAELLDCFEADAPEYFVLKGQSLLDKGNCAEAKKFFLRALKGGVVKESHDVQALKGLAVSCMHLGQYADAQEAYAQLVREAPENIVYQLNQSVAMLETYLVDEAVNQLFRLNYLHPENQDVLRVLAWALLLQQRNDVAERYYGELLAQSNPSADDYLNAGYSSWLMGSRSEAVTRFSEFLKKSNSGNYIVSLREAFARDKHLLDVYGVDALERQLMIEATDAAAR